MNRELFVQNIKQRCAAMGVNPTTACRESGVGTSFINDIDRGRTPSVGKVQMLAQYLGCTVSELLGEQKERPAEGEALGDDLTAGEQALLQLWRDVPAEKQEGLLLAIEVALRNQGLL